jgi:hypothetical protein
MNGIRRECRLEGRLWEYCSSRLITEGRLLPTSLPWWLSSIRREARNQLF